MRREDLDALVLGGLQQRLMDPALCALFCAEYTRHRNRLHAERNAQRKTARNALVKTERKLDRLVQALMERRARLPREGEDGGARSPQGRAGGAACGWRG